MKIALARRVAFDANELVHAIEKRADAVELHLRLLAIIATCSELERDLRETEKRKIFDG